MKTQHYLQSLCMALAMIVMIPAQLCALTGQGNSTSPYQIGSASDLREFRDIVNGSNGQTRNISAWAVLTNDIEDLGAWTPIGNSSGHYKGTFDGQGHSITGMTLLNYTKVNQGLFGYIENATVRNFTLSGEMSSSTQINSGDDDCSGTVVGYAKGSSHIENVTSHVNWTLTALQKHLGGIVGQIQDNTQVRGCTYTGTLDAGASREGLGGIVGYAYTSDATSIAYCLFSGTIRTTSTNNDLTYVGGILGYINDETSKGTFGGVSYCFAGGTLETSVSKCRAAIIACPKGKALHNGNVDHNYYLASTADKALGNDKTPETGTVNQGITVALTTNNPDFGTATQRYVSPTWNAAESSGTATQLEVSAVPASHYHYVGWSDQGEQTHTRALTQDVIAQANFAIDRHTITIRRNYDYRSTVSCELNGAAVELQTEEDGEHTIYKATFDYGAKPVFICTPADYCVFDKWSTGSTKNRLTYEVQGDATLTANCNKLTYEVNLEVQGEGSVSGSSPSNVKQWTSATEGYGDAFNNVTLVATPAAHYHLDSWSDNHHNTYSPGHSGDDYTCTTDDNGVNTLVLKIKANTTFYATFAIDQHIITLGEVTNGTITQSGSGTYDYNTPITLTATPAEHYHFVNWSDGTNTYDGTPQEDGSNTLAVTVTGDATYSATFAIDQHAITANSNDADMGTVTGGDTYDYNTPITLTAIPAEHYHFVNWSDGTNTYDGTPQEDGSNTLAVTVTGAATYTATFAIDQHAITLGEVANGTITQSGSGTYDYNTPITLTATPAEHYHFVNWSDGTNTYDGTPQEDGSNTLAVTVTGDATFTAAFDIDQPYLVPTYNKAIDPTSGIASWATGYVADYTTVTDATEAVTWSAGWYVVDSEVTITGRITCSGAVHLILAQGGRLEAKAGITVSGADNSLTIYGQPDGSGELIATGGKYAAGIGGGDGGSGDNITINGGTVDAQGGGNGAGIGGGDGGSGDNITINGGIVDAQGGGVAAGIGGGIGGSGNNITINGGIVDAQGGGRNGAGIGSGGGGGVLGNNITINGGTVGAQGGEHAAGIGGGNRGSGNNITINGGTVDAQGGDGAAGIGGGYYGSGENITINGGTVDAQGGYHAAGIGGGYNGSGNNIKVSTTLTIYNTGSSNAVITNNGGDCASALSGIQSVFVCVPHTHQYDGQAVADKYLSVAATCTSLATYYYSCSICGLCEKNSNRTFEAGVMLPHNFTAEVASESYLASAATCTAHDTYYYSCAVCGANEKDDEHTFEGTTYCHLFDDDGKCTKCDAQGIPFLEPTYNTVSDPTSGIESWATGYVADYTTVTDATEAVTWSDGWYVVNREVTITGRITCSGAVNLILAQGGRLEAKAGITVSGADNSLTIYGQPDGSGELIATGGSEAAGIGGGDGGSGNNITINGGIVDAQGGDGAAGIGGGYGGSGENITINGGTVDAQGGDHAAGIGGGDEGSGNNITINGGIVDAQGGSYGAGIGGGFYGSGNNIKVSTTLTIYNTGSNNAVITNSGSDLASALSGIQSVLVCVPHTHQYDGQAVADKYILVAATCTSLATYYYSCSICGLCEKDSNRTFEAGVMLPHNFTAEVASESYLASAATCTAHDTYYYSCAVCGANEKDDEHTFEGTTYCHLFDDDGKCTKCDAQGIPFLEPTYITASNPTSGIASWATRYVAEYTTVTDADSETWPAGWYVVDSEVTITKRITCSGAVHLILAQGGRLEAKAGITVSGADNSLTIYGQPDGSGELIATGGKYAAGIGGGDWGSGNNITINGGIVDAQGGYCAAGIGGGGRGSGNNITINGGIVDAQGSGDNGAGIGGGYGGSGENITINGGTVDAQGGVHAAGIGGGTQGSGNNITINGGTVDAQGGYDGAGIGGGYNGSGENITINGGIVDAQGGGDAAGIGGGYYGSGENIKVSTTLTIYNTGNDNAVITNSGGDLASALRVRYAFVCLAGDINADGHLSIADLTLLIDLLSRDTISITPAADVNGADGVTRDDIEALRDKLLR